MPAVDDGATETTAETTSGTRSGTGKRSDPRSPLGRRFLVIWAAQTLSTMGSTLSAIGVAVHVYLETGSEAWLGILAALAGLPVLLVGPFLGLVDRYDRRSVMIVGDIIAAAGSPPP